MYTGYYIERGHIYGPKEGGHYYIERGYIHGPRNGGQYYLDKPELLGQEDTYIYGPKGGGRFYISKHLHIYGPSESLPWMER